MAEKEQNCCSKLALEEPQSKSNKKCVYRIKDPYWSSAAKNSTTVVRNLHQRTEIFSNRSGCKSYWKL